MSFIDPKVSDKYTTAFNYEQQIHMPGYGEHKPFYKKLKDLTLEEADVLYGNPDKNNILVPLTIARPALSKSQSAKGEENK